MGAMYLCSKFNQSVLLEEKRGGKKSLWHALCAACREAGVWARGSVRVQCPGRKGIQGHFSKEKLQLCICFMLCLPSYSYSSPFQTVWKPVQQCCMVDAGVLWLKKGTNKVKDGEEQLLRHTLMHTLINCAMSVALKRCWRRCGACRFSQQLQSPCVMERLMPRDA